MRPDRLYLLDIIEAADRVEVHLAERDRERFLADVTRQAAEERSPGDGESLRRRGRSSGPGPGE
jgi:hypothetical protein